MGRIPVIKSSGTLVIASVRWGGASGTTNGAGLSEPAGGVLQNRACPSVTSMDRTQCIGLCLETPVAVGVPADRRPTRRSAATKAGLSGKA